MYIHRKQVLSALSICIGFNPASESIMAN